MGKKSKRRGGKRNIPNQLQRKGVEKGHSNAIEKFQRIRRDIEALLNEGVKLANGGFLSETRRKCSEVQFLLKSEKEILLKNRLEFHCYYSTYSMCACKIDTSTAVLAFLKYTHTKEDILKIGAIWQVYIFEFCRMKEWTEALDLNKRVGAALDQGTDWYNSHLIRATIYIEQYRVEASKRPKSERMKMSLSLHQYISIEICKAWERKNHTVWRMYTNTQYIYLLHAQWLYLNRHGTFISETVVNSIVKSKENIEGYTFSFALASLVQNRLDTMFSLEANLCFCCEVIVPESSALVCSGCRVACFCSLEHQRSSWKKDIRGLGIGHKMLCPLLKTYRKYKDAKRTQKGNENEYLLRFERECEIFFSESLGPREIVDQNYEECKGLFDFSTMDLHSE
ncbi:predicted protein [Chaetoceros tenuissimus]|uniref:MYND-type domain-containing protein n=1 Tax=Chaetoceros tenuissimus TaxID=426638 RepID=A0AAD3D8J4_9STRA|nr:predicted protein [Chaetoceros tenuissimus]